MAWRSERNHTGIAVIRGGPDGGEFVSSAYGIRSGEAAAGFVARYATPDTVVAVDAPLVIRNQTGQRPCETMIGRRFGRYDASAHTSNLSLYPEPGSVTFVCLLETAGFIHDPEPSTLRRRAGRWVFEVYPHPAQVVLFQLDRILKYKKGNLAAKRAGLALLRRHMASLHKLEPSLSSTRELKAILEGDLDTMTGRELKWHEDTLDALFCAYLAFHVWYWGAARNEMIGDLQTGYIINPLPQMRALAS